MSHNDDPILVGGDDISDSDDFHAVAMTGDDGRWQTVISSTKVFESDDYGLTWTKSHESAQDTWRALAMCDSSGSYDPYRYGIKQMIVGHQSQLLRAGASAEPTSIPSAAPSGAPTLTPTFEGQSVPPTSLPTGRDEDRRVRTVLADLYGKTAHPRSTDHSLSYQSTDMIHSASAICRMWVNFVNQLKLHVYTLRVQEPIGLGMTVINSTSPSDPVYINHGCDDKAIVRDIYNMLGSGIAGNVTCNGSVWLFDSCPQVDIDSPVPINASVLCVGEACVGKNLCTTSQDAQGMFRPCRHHSDVRHLNVPTGNGTLGRRLVGNNDVMSLILVFRSGFDDLLEPPDIISLDFNIGFRTVAARLSFDSSYDGDMDDVGGKVYCGGFHRTKGAPTSHSAISLLSQSSSYDAGDAIVFISLDRQRFIPLEQYNIFCMVETHEGTKSDMERVVEKFEEFVEPCCKQVFARPIMDVLVAGRVQEESLMLAVDFLPNEEIVVAVAVNCTESGQVGTPFFPREVTFGPGSPLSRHVDFVTGNDDNLFGNCSLLVSIHGASENEFVVSNDEAVRSKRLIIVGQNSQLPPPDSMEAVFDEWGTSVLVSFNRPTDRQGNTGGTFDCTDIFSDDGTCVWLDARRVSVTSKHLLVGSILSLNSEGGVQLRASCELSENICLEWEYASNMTTQVKASERAEGVHVIMTTNKVVSDCEDILVDLSASMGSGGRPWQSGSMKVTALSTSDDDPIDQSALAGINEWVKEQLDLIIYSLSAPFVQIPSAMLSAGTSLTFKLTLCNFLRICGDDSRSVSVVSSADFSGVPRVWIAGPSEREHANHHELLVKASGVTRDCLRVGSDDLSALAFSWSVEDADTGLVLSDVTSLAKDPSLFKLNPYTLVAGKTYTVRVTCTNVRTSASDSATMAVYITPVVRVAARLGSATRVTLLPHGIWSKFLLDVSASYDLLDGFPSDSLLFSWSCQQILPNFLPTRCPALEFAAVTNVNETWTDFESCGINRRNRVDKIKLGYVAGGSLTFVSVTVWRRSDDSYTKLQRMVTKTFEIYTIEGLVDVPPNGVMNVVNEDDTHIRPDGTIVINANRTLLMSGSVYYDNSATAQWSVDPPVFDFERLALSVLSLEFPDPGNREAIQRVSLTIPPGTLSNNVVYTFKLEATLAKLTLNDIRSTSSSLKVYTNKGPTPGRLTITPAEARALVDVFRLDAALFEDEDLPLSYTFGYFDVFANSSKCHVRPSPHAFPMAQMPLPYNISKVFVDVNDAFQATTTEVTDVHVIDQVSSEATAQLLANLTLQTAVVTSMTPMEAEANFAKTVTVTTTLRDTDTSLASNETSLFDNATSTLIELSHGLYARFSDGDLHTVRSAVANLHRIVTLQSARNTTLVKITNDTLSFMSQLASDVSLNGEGADNALTLSMLGVMDAVKPEIISDGNGTWGSVPINDAVGWLADARGRGFGPSDKRIAFEGRNLAMGFGAFVEDRIGLKRVPKSVSMEIPALTGVQRPCGSCEAGSLTLDISSGVDALPLGVTAIDASYYGMATTTVEDSQGETKGNAIIGSAAVAPVTRIDVPRISESASLVRACNEQKKVWLVVQPALFRRATDGITTKRHGDISMRPVCKTITPGLRCRSKGSSSCECDLCSFPRLSRTPSDDAHSTRRRLVSVDSSSTGYAEFVLLMEYIVKDFGEANTEWGDFYAMYAASTMVWSTFLVLFLLLLVPFFCHEVILHRKSKVTSAAVGDYPDESSQKSDRGDASAKMKHMLTYIDSIFPRCFSTLKSDLRLSGAMVEQHLLLAVFYGDSRSARSLALLEVITLVNLSLLLVALFIGVEIQHDDDTCNEYNNQTECEAEVSTYDNEMTMCRWDNKAKNCEFNEVQTNSMHFAVLLLISLIVSTPIRVLFSVIFDAVLNTPTAVCDPDATAYFDEEFHVTGRRKSLLVRHLSQMGNTVIKGASTSQQVKDYFKYAFDTWKKMSVFRTFAITGNPMPVTLVVPDDAKRLRTELVRPSAVRQVASSDNINSRDGDVLASLQPEELLKSLELDLIQLIKDGTKKDVDAIKADWQVQIVKRKGMSAVKWEKRDVILAAISSTLANARARCSAMRYYPDATIGTELLRLFVLDMLGKDSHHGRVFDVRSKMLFRSSRVVSAEVKTLAYGFIVYFNYYALSTCVAYAFLNGEVWQKAWLVTSLICVLFLLLIDATFEAYVVGYAIPTLVMPSIRKVQSELKRHMVATTQFMGFDSLWSSRTSYPTSDAENPQPHVKLIPRLGNAHATVSSAFSSTKYLHESNMLARYYPYIPEGNVIRAYATTSSCGIYQLKSHTVGQSNDGSGASTPREEEPPAESPSLTLSRVLSRLGVSFAFMIVYLGGLPTLAQRLLVTLPMPCITSILTGFALLSSVSYVVISVIMGLLMLLLVTALIWRLSYHRSSVSKVDIVKSQRATVIINNVINVKGGRKSTGNNKSKASMKAKVSKIGSGVKNSVKAAIATIGKNVKNVRASILQRKSETSPSVKKRSTKGKGVSLPATGKAKKRTDMSVQDAVHKIQRKVRQSLIMMAKKKSSNKNNDKQKLTTAGSRKGKAGGSAIKGVGGSSLKESPAQRKSSPVNRSMRQTLIRRPVSVTVDTRDNDDDDDDDDGKYTRTARSTKTSRSSKTARGRKRVSKAKSKATLKIMPRKSKGGKK